jgi:hypothetical protein
LLELLVRDQLIGKHINDKWLHLSCDRRAIVANEKLALQLVVLSAKSCRGVRKLHLERMLNMRGLEDLLHESLVVRGELVVGCVAELPFVHEFL